MDVDYFEMINLNDWPLRTLFHWFTAHTDGGDSMPLMIFAAVDNTVHMGHPTKWSNFLDLIIRAPRICGRMCRNVCQNSCATMGNFRFKLLAEGLDEFANFDNYKDDVLHHFFFKLNDAINQDHVKYRIGLLVLFRDDPRENDFIRKERHLIMSQLSNRFYVTDYLLVDFNDEMFNHIKRYVDSVVIIADANYRSRVLDGYYAMLTRFSFLKVFVVKTEDVANQPDETIRIHYQALLQNNEIIIYNWLRHPEGLPETIRKHLTPSLRMKIAISSYFIRNKRLDYNNDQVVDEDVLPAQ